MDIHQVSVSYLNEQDRILVRINTRKHEEIRLWLTRRFCLGWRPALQQLLNQLAARSMSSARRPSSAAPECDTERDLPERPQATDFTTPFKTDAMAWPLGTEPLLVTKVQMTTNARDGLDLRFEELLTEHQPPSRGFQASLEPVLLQGWVQLLDRALGQSQWLAAAARTVWRSDAREDEAKPSGYLH